MRQVSHRSTEGYRRLSDESHTSNDVHYSLVNRHFLRHLQQSCSAEKLVGKWDTVSTSLPEKYRYFSKVHHPGYAKAGGDTPGKSWWGYAARSSKSWPYFRPKNVIFLTQRKYCVVLSIYMVYIRENPGAQRSSQSRALKVLLIQSRGMNPQPPRYIYWPTNHASFNSELYRGSTLFC